MRTRGLTFLQKTGEASTTQQVEFQLPRGAGTSLGADYDSKTGVVVLNSQVHMTTSSNGKPAVVDAARATLLRSSDQALLVNATLNYETENGSADQAIVYFRKDGTAEKIDAQGHVRMKTDTGATVDAATARIWMDAKSQPTQADLGGGVQFASARENETMRGSASDGTLLFETLSTGPHAQTGLRHGEFRQNVTFDEEVTGLAKDPRGHAAKQLHAEKVDVEFAPPQAGQPVEARKAIAEGSPVVTSRQTPSKGPEQTTRISGDQLVATLDEGNALRQLDGTGNTQIVQSATDGSHNASKGDLLHATFIQQPRGGSGKSGSGRREPGECESVQNREEEGSGPEDADRARNGHSGRQRGADRDAREEAGSDDAARNPDRLGAARRVSRCRPVAAPDRQSQDHRRRGDADGRGVDRLSPRHAKRGGERQREGDLHAAAEERPERGAGCRIRGRRQQSGARHRRTRDPGARDESESLLRNRAIAGTHVAGCRLAAGPGDRD